MGRIGPPLLAEGAQAHFIEMQGRDVCGGASHATESIIYTVRGRWVLCSKGRRRVMTAGSLFRFGRDIPTGYEVPFRDPAFILIFKGDRTTRKEREFIDYLQQMGRDVEREHRQGVPFHFRDLKRDHPAVTFARQVNPRLDRDFPVSSHARTGSHRH